MSYTHIKSYRQRLKERAVYVLGGKCQCCGYDKCTAALEFHHLDPSIKEFTVSQNANRSWTTVRQEIQKCILLCSNCHRELHAGLISESNLKSSFDEAKALEIDAKIENLKNHKIQYCKCCGAEITSKAQLCVTCASEKRRVAQRPSREELKQLIRTKSFLDIGCDFNVSDNAVKKWCVALGLPSKKSDIKAISDYDWESI